MVGPLALGGAAGAAAGVPGVDSADSSITMEMRG